MTGYIPIIIWLIEAKERAYERKWVFLGISAFVFLGSIFTLGKFDLLPEISRTSTKPIVTLSASSLVTASSTEVVIEEPVQVEIPKIDITSIVVNPTATDIESLDRSLLRGVVRYPTSAKLGETGNVVLFGHSSYLPVVGNDAYKAFNGIQKLVAGDVVIVSSESIAYTYQVRSVTKANANDAGIPLKTDGRVLTLATCDSFGAKADRFIVVADFVESHSISI